MFWLLRKLRKAFINLLGFSKTETNGLLVLILLVVLMAILPRIYFSLLHTTPESDDTTLTNWVHEIENSMEEIKATPDEGISYPLKTFNPNISDRLSLEQSGVPSLLARNIANYRSKGGYFKNRNDLRKIYGMTDSLFSALEPFISIPEQKTQTRQPFKKEWTNEKTSDFYFALNSATPEELQYIRGIGEVLSERIIGFRNLLGGFISYGQLSDVYELSPEVIEKIKDHSTLGSEITQLPINQIDSIKHLSNHPYINYKLAKTILNYRRVHGYFESIEDLKNIKTLNDSTYKKIAPYLSL